MPAETNFTEEYQTAVVGAGYLVKSILRRLDLVEVIDDTLKHQPEIEATYGTLAQVIIINRMSFQPQPLYHLSDWATRHGIDRVLGIKAAWLDDDRMGALLEAVADHQVTIWSAVLQKAIQRFGVDLTWLHSDTTSVYFEGAYQDKEGNPKGGDKRVPRLVEGYNKDGKRKKVQLVLSLITSGRLPVWYRSWDGNQTDEAVYLADMTDLRQNLLVPANTVLIGDRKLCNQATMLAFCQQGQQFLAAHPWTNTAKSVWLKTWQKLKEGQLQWLDADYVSRNDARKPPEERPRYRVCEGSHNVEDPQNGQVYPVRWAFSWFSRKEAQAAGKRAKALQQGEQALRRVADLLVKYDYKSRKVIETRIEKALRKARASRYYSYTLIGTDEEQNWSLHWEQLKDVIKEAQCFDGIALLCTNVPATRLSSEMVIAKYKQQVGVEQTIDFIKSPVQIRPMWLHSPKRLAGLTLLIMIAVLIAALLEYQVRRWIAKTGQLLKGLMPEKRDNRYPTAKAILRACNDYAIVIHRYRGREKIYYPKLRPVQQQIWSILGLAPLPGEP